VRFIARGMVQGVFFRDSLRQEAERRGVAGWVVNRPDGAVEGTLEGQEGTVDSMVEFCRAGPGESSVESLEAWEVEPEGDRGFEVRSG
jgi:acylphosphatase